MKSVYSIANEIGVTHQNIRNRLTPEFIKQFRDHIIKQEGNIYFDIEVEKNLKLIFNTNDVKNNFVHNNDLELFDNLISMSIHPLVLQNVYWISHLLHFPLSCPPNVLMQAVDNHRAKLMILLLELDNITNQLIPTDYSHWIELKKYRHL